MLYFFINSLIRYNTEDYTQNVFLLFFIEFILICFNARVTPMLSLHTSNNVSVSYMNITFTHIRSTCSVTVCLRHRWMFRDVHKEIIQGQRTVTGRWKNASRKLALAVAPCHLEARKSCSFLTSFLSIRLFLCSRIADRWQMERRRSSTIHSTGYNCSTTDWLLPSGLLCKLYTTCLYPLVSSRPSSRIP